MIRWWIHVRLSLSAAILTVWLTGAVFAETNAKQKSESHTGPLISRSLSNFPVRLDQLFVRAAWGLDDAARVQCRLVNKSDASWKAIKADPGCTCLEIKVSEIPEAGIAPGDSATLTVAYEKPDEPQIVGRTIRLLIDEAKAELPVLVEWQTPLSLKTIKQRGDESWLATGEVRQGFKLASIDSLDKDIDVLSWDTDGNVFEIALKAKVRTTQYCSLRCIATTGDQKPTSVEQVLRFSLESSAPRSIPSRLMCQLSAAGKLSGSTRILFPRIRTSARPDLVRCELVTKGSDETIPLKATVDPLGKIAMKIAFETEKPLLETITERDSEVRFLFKDGSSVHCHFQIRKEEK